MKEAREMKGRGQRPGAPAGLPMSTIAHLLPASCGIQPDWLCYGHGHLHEDQRSEFPAAEAALTPARESLSSPNSPTRT